MASSPPPPNQGVPNVQMSPVDPNEESYRTLVKKIDHEVEKAKKDARSPVESIEIHQMLKLVDSNHWGNYAQRRNELANDLGAAGPNQQFLFLTSPYVDQIAINGIDMARDAYDGTFGCGIYLTQSVLNASRYAFNARLGCSAHSKAKCSTCVRKMLVCKVLLGKSYRTSGKVNLGQLQAGYHSVRGEINGRPSDVFVIFDSYQIIPTYYVEFKTSFKRSNEEPRSRSNPQNRSRTESRRGESALQNQQGSGLVSAISTIAPIMFQTLIRPTPFPLLPNTKVGLRGNILGSEYELNFKISN